MPLYDFTKGKKSAEHWIELNVDLLVGLFCWAAAESSMFQGFMMFSFPSYSKKNGTKYCLGWNELLYLAEYFYIRKTAAALPSFRFIHMMPSISLEHVLCSIWCSIWCVDPNFVFSPYNWLYFNIINNFEHINEVWPNWYIVKFLNHVDKDSIRLYDYVYKKYFISRWNSPEWFLCSWTNFMIFHTN